MPQTIQCVNCGVVLNLPAEAAGRKIKCPKCGAKFLAGGQAATQPPASPRGPGGPDSTFELTRKGSALDLDSMPNAPGDLRDTFGLPMMADPAAGKKGKPPGKESSTADAKFLFDDKPPPRKKTGAEARAQARRCPNCGGIVQVGMSVCKTCGLDLETGSRAIDLTDDLLPPTNFRRESYPLPIGIVGGACAAVSAALGIAALAGWARGGEGLQYFIPVAIFGVYAAVQFIRLKSVKLLLIALTLGAVIDVAGLIGLPIYVANAETALSARSDRVDDPDLEYEFIAPLSERLDQSKIRLGIVLIFAYGVFSIYLLSGSVQKHFRR